MGDNFRAAFRAAIMAAGALGKNSPASNRAARAPRLSSRPVNAVFELAPRSRRHNWDKAMAFAIAPAAPTFAAVYFLAENITLASVVAGIGFVGTAICAWTISSTPLGRATLTPDELLLESGFLQTRVPLAELDLAAARPGDTAEASPRLDTRTESAVTIPRHQGPAVVVTPLNRDAFLTALRARAGLSAAPSSPRLASTPRAATSVPSPAR